MAQSTLRYEEDLLNENIYYFNVRWQKEVGNIENKKFELEAQELQQKQEADWLQLEQDCISTMIADVSQQENFLQKQQDDLMNRDHILTKQAQSVEEQQRQLDAQAVSIEDRKRQLTYQAQSADKQ